MGKRTFWRPTTSSLSDKSGDLDAGCGMRSTGVASFTGRHNTVSGRDSYGFFAIVSHTVSCLLLLLHMWYPLRD